MSVFITDGSEPAQPAAAAFDAERVGLGQHRMAQEVEHRRVAAARHGARCG